MYATPKVFRRGQQAKKTVKKPRRIASICPVSIYSEKQISGSPPIKRNMNDHSDNLSLGHDSNGVLFGSQSKGKQSLQSQPAQIGSNQKSTYLSVGSLKSAAFMTAFFSLYIVGVVL